MNEMDEGSSLRSSEPSAAGQEERVTLTRAELMSGILVGIGGEHDVVPSQEQLDRTVDMIFRYVRRRDALATQGAAGMLAPLLWPQADPSPESTSEACQLQANSKSDLDLDATPSPEFFEEDEPVEDIKAAFDGGLKFTTAPPTSAAPVRLSSQEEAQP